MSPPLPRRQHDDFILNAFGSMWTQKSTRNPTTPFEQPLPTATVQRFNNLSPLMKYGLVSWVIKTKKTPKIGTFGQPPVPVMAPVTLNNMMDRLV